MGGQRVFPVSHLLTVLGATFNFDAKSRWDSRSKAVCKSGKGLSMSITALGNNADIMSFDQPPCK
jgi:hypothetical protein